MTYYEVLEVTPAASEDMIQMAYLVMVKRYNPDTYPGEKEIAERRMTVINKAYMVLSDPDVRKRYDQYLQNKGQDYSNETIAKPTSQLPPSPIKRMKYCTHCGQPIEETAQICLKCGKGVVLPPSPAKSTKQLKPIRTNRSLLKYILFSLLTFGIYPIVMFSEIGCEVNFIATPYDGKKTMHYCWLYFIFSWLTFGIAPLVWGHRLCNRIGSELDRRNLNFTFNAKTLWLWGGLGILIIIGPLVFTHKLLFAMNLLADDFNKKGA